MKYLLALILTLQLLIAIPLSVRLNNPGNIKYSKHNKWNGSIYKGDGRFEVFYEAYFGIRALDIVLLANIRATNSVAEFVQRYALEPNETIMARHAQNYIKALVEALGYSGKIKEEDIAILRRVVIFREGGDEAITYYKRFLERETTWR